MEKKLIQFSPSSITFYGANVLVSSGWPFATIEISNEYIKLFCPGTLLPGGSFVIMKENITEIKKVFRGVEFYYRVDKQTIDMVRVRNLFSGKKLMNVLQEFGYEVK